MALLLETDYAILRERGLCHTEDEGQRFLVLKNYPLPDGIYHEERCDVLVIIPQDYNQAGNDMLWTYPHLSRLDGKPIPATNKPGDGNSRKFEGREFCRWSRHWNHDPVKWKAGEDDIATILHRIEWVLGNPDSE